LDGVRLRRNRILRGGDREIPVLGRDEVRHVLRAARRERDPTLGDEATMMLRLRGAEREREEDAMRVVRGELVRALDLRLRLFRPCANAEARARRLDVEELDPAGLRVPETRHPRRRRLDAGIRL